MPIKQFSLAVLVCGVLDIGYAIATTMLKGGTATMVLNGVASGPFGDRFAGVGGAFVGLAVHFAIMSVMVAAYFAAARNTRLGDWSPWLAGTAYGLLAYLVMYFVVLPLRWPSIFPQTDALQLAMSLFPHIALVGIPLAFIAARTPMTIAPAH